MAIPTRNLDKHDETMEVLMTIPVPLLLQGSEWLLVVLVVAIPVIVIGLVVYVIIKLGLAGAGALDRYGRSNAAQPASYSSGTGVKFCSACGASLPLGSKFCLNCGKQV